VEYKFGTEARDKEVRGDKRANDSQNKKRAEPTMAPARLLSEKRRDMELPKDIERPKERSRKPHKHTTKPSSVVSSTTTKSRYKTISPTATSNHYKTTPLSAREEPTRTHRRKRTSTPQSSSSESSPDDSDGGDGAENAWAVNDATTRAFPSPPTSASPTGESSSNTKAVSARSSRDADAPQPNDEDEAPILSPGMWVQQYWTSPS
jgi:hypothetical protein